MLLAVALAGTMAVTTPEPDTEQNGHALLALCGDYASEESRKPDALTLGCLSYVAGLMDGIHMHGAFVEYMGFFDNLHHVRMLSECGATPKSTADVALQLYKRHVVDDLAPPEDVVRSAALMLPKTSRSVLTHQICIPKEVRRTGQLALVIVKFLRDHPERLHESRTALAHGALEAAFPCPKEK